MFGLPSKTPTFLHSNCSRFLMKSGQDSELLWHCMVFGALLIQVSRVGVISTSSAIENLEFIFRAHEATVTL